MEETLKRTSDLDTFNMHAETCERHGAIRYVNRILNETSNVMDMLDIQELGLIELITEIFRA
jgi:hypothetical protein